MPHIFPVSIGLRAMFLAQRMTTSNIHFENTVLPPAGPLSQLPVPENQQILAEKE